MHNTQSSKHSDWALRLLAVLAVLYTLRLARDVMLPITLALIFALLLAPAVSRLQCWRLPRSAAALLILSACIGSIGAGFYALASPASEWLQRAPEAAEVIRDHLREVNSERSNVDAATASIDSLAEEFSGPANPKINKVVIADTGWRGEIWEIARNFGVYGTLSIILLFFLLSSGDALMQRFINSLPNKQDKAAATQLARHAQEQMSRYLLTITLVNVGVGAITTMCLWLLDFPDPALWGAVAALLRYIPYLGVSITVMLLTIVSAVSFQTPALVLVAPLGYTLFTALVGQFVDPFIHGMRFSLNPIIVFLWIFFWGWLWGAPGVLLAVPLLTLFQVVCKHVDSLKPIANIIGDANDIKTQ